MNNETWLEKEIRTAIERKAYAHGVPESISVLIAEYSSKLMTELYAKRTEKLVSTSL